MSLEKAPPSRYRVEEKNGRLIVHDTQSGSVLGNQFANRPVDRSGSALNSASAGASNNVEPRASALSLIARASQTLDKMERSVSSSELSALKGTADQERAKRGAIVAIAAIALLFFAIFTGLWIGLVIAVIVTPVRKALIDKLLPAIKLYVAEGRWR